MWCSATKAIVGTVLGVLWHAEPFLDRLGAPWQAVAATFAAILPFNGGTGFFVNANGDFLSALHVVDRCAHPALQTPEGIVVGRIVAKSEQLDLAVIRTDQARDAYARFPDYPTQWLVEPVSVGRYRACGGLGSWDVVPATATSMPGFGGGLLALAAADAMEAGNSGSPVIERNGAVAGMVTARLEQRSETGIAVNATVIARFLAASGVPYQTVPSVLFLLPEGLGTAAAQHAFPLLCL